MCFLLFFAGELSPAVNPGSANVVLGSGSISASSTWDCVMDVPFQLVLIYERAYLGSI